MILRDGPGERGAAVRPAEKGSVHYDYCHRYYSPYGPSSRPSAVMNAFEVRFPRRGLGSLTGFVRIAAALNVIRLFFFFSSHFVVLKRIINVLNHVRFNVRFY